MLRFRLLALLLFLGAPASADRHPAPPPLPGFSIIQPPPEGPVWNPAEFHRVDKVFIVYPLSIPWPLVAEISRGVMVYCLLADSVFARGQADFQRNGVAMANVKFLPYFTKATFTRDFMPWVIFDGKGRPGLVDPKYWRDAEDTVAHYLGRNLGVPVYPLDIAIEGGNYMSDGMGVGMATTLVHKANRDKSVLAIDQAFKAYLGLKTFHVREDPESRPDGEVLEHIDCWAKFLAPDKVLLKRLPRSDSNHARMEAAVEWFRRQTSSYGTPYRIYRMDAPRDEPFVNSLIVNDKIFLGIKGFGNDSAALRLYREIMPGYKVFGYMDDRPGYQPVMWYGRDALHCRTFGFTDFGILRIDHIPLHDTLAPVQGGFAVEAGIRPYSGRGVVPDSVRVYYRPTGAVTFASVAMRKEEGFRYRAVIPSPAFSAEMQYFVRAADSSGRAESHPFIGGADPHRFVARVPAVWAAAPGSGKARLMATGWGVPAPGSLESRESLAIYDLSGKRISTLRGDGSASGTGNGVAAARVWRRLTPE